MAQIHFGQEVVSSGILLIVKMLKIQSAIHSAIHFKSIVKTPPQLDFGNMKYYKRVIHTRKTSIHSVFYNNSQQSGTSVFATFD